VAGVDAGIGGAGGSARLIGDGGAGGAGGDVGLLGEGGAGGDGGDAGPAGIPGKGGAGGAAPEGTPPLRGEGRRSRADSRLLTVSALARNVGDLILWDSLGSFGRSCGGPDSGVFVGGTALE
jgi:hypothetical protein